MTTARDERLALCDLMEQLGPTAPTLCEGWLTKDLAAHLVLRERRPDAAAGILVKPLAGYTAKVQQQLATQPYVKLIELVRTGPPRWSPTRLATADRMANTIEMVVHHEDVRRAQPGWSPREADPARDYDVWDRISFLGHLAVRKAPVGVSIERPGGLDYSLKPGDRRVTVFGEPIELALLLTGRRAVARVELRGAPGDVEAFNAVSLGL